MSWIASLINKPMDFRGFCVPPRRLHADGLVVLIHNRLPGNRCPQSRHTLLTINKVLASLGQIASLEAHLRFLPRDVVSDWKAAIKTVREASELRGIPDKGPLNFGDRDFPRLDPSEQQLDDVLVDGIFLHAHWCSPLHHG